MEISLSKLKWELKGYWPHVPLKVVSMETGQVMHGVTDWIPATVPGGVHVDLWKAGLIDNPYWGLNSLHCEWVENRWWMYRTHFDKTLIENIDGKQVELLFKGIDYEAIVFLNNEEIGSHKGMFASYAIDITNIIKEDNELIVIFKNVPEEMGQIGYTSKTKTQKSRFNYKWDFSTKLINLGLWQDVVLDVKNQYAIENLRTKGDYVEGKGEVSVRGEIASLDTTDSSNLKVAVTVEEPNSGEAIIKAEIPVVREKFEETFTILNPQIWAPNGYGQPNLYEVTIQLLLNDTVIDETMNQVGLRSVSFVQNEGDVKNALPYTFVVNGEKVYVKGVNLVPVDHLYGNVLEEQYKILVQQMVNANINLARVWGGGLIETSTFYKLCDQNGIMVWQDFIQSSSGLDNKPSEDPQFMELLKENTISAIKRVRNHSSLVIYCGGNELRDDNKVPVTTENKNISMLKELAEVYDGRTHFIPATGSGPRPNISKDKGVSHDVHGWWHYVGNPEHYELYGKSDNLFHSEFGVGGCSSEKSLKKFLPKEDLYPALMVENSRWKHHGEWWDTLIRDTGFFGEFKKDRDGLKKFVSCSQFIQSEGLRYIVEADARRAFENSGVIIWQFGEPWPNASCTSLVYYYGEEKSVYYTLKRSFEENHPSIDYSRLNNDSGTELSLPVFLTNVRKAKELNVTAVIRDNG